MPQKTGAKTQKHHQHCQNALRRFLVMSAMIGRNYAPDFDGAYPQGAQCGFLESFMVVGTDIMVDTLVLCTLFVRAAPAIILHVL